MVPHLERAHQGLQICAFHHTQTHEDTHMHDCTHVCIPPHAHACTCTHTHTTNTCITGDGLVKKEMTNQQAEQKWWVFDFDLKTVKWNA